MIASRIEQPQDVYKRQELLFIHRDRLSQKDQERLSAMLKKDEVVKQQLVLEQQAYHNRNIKRSKLKLYNQNS